MSAGPTVPASRTPSSGGPDTYCLPMANPPAHSRTALVLGLVFLAAGVALIVAHLVLDAGDGEAPRWIVYAAIVSSLAAAFLGGTYGRRR